MRVTSTETSSGEPTEAAARSGGMPASSGFRTLLAAGDAGDAADAGLKPEVQARIAVLMQQEGLEQQDRLERQRRMLVRTSVILMLALIAAMAYFFGR